MNGLGDRIRKLRKEKNYTLRELAEKLNISFSLLAMYERGERTPPIDKLLLIANHFSVSIDYLLGKNPEEKSFYMINNEQNDANIVSEDNTNVNTYIQLNSLEELDNKEEFYIYVNDNSMNGSRIQKGDFVLVNKQCKVANGQIALVYLKTKNLFLIRKVFFEEDNVKLEADHLDYRVNRYSAKEIEIVGKVIRVEFTLY